MNTSIVVPLGEQMQPYAVRTSCGHVVERRMRPSTAGVEWSASVVIEAPHGRACGPCGAVREAEAAKAHAIALEAATARWSACTGHERDVDGGTLLCRHCGKSLAAEIRAAREVEEKAARKSRRAK